MDKQTENAKSKGTHVDQPGDYVAKSYALYNEIQGGEEGFDMQTWSGIIGKYMVIYGTLKAADSQ